MTASTLPLWVILSIIGLMFAVIVGNINYYLPPISKLKAQCLSDKSSKQRNNYILELKQRLDEEYYYYIAAVIYVVISVCFCIENYRSLLGTDYVVLKIILILAIWVLLAILAISFLVGLMITCQHNAIRSLKEHYQHRYGVIVVSLDQKHIEEYNELSRE